MQKTSATSEKIEQFSDKENKGEVCLMEQLSFLLTRAHPFCPKATLLSTFKIN